MPGIKTALICVALLFASDWISGEGILGALGGVSLKIVAAICGLIAAFQLAGTVLSMLLTGAARLVRR